MKAVSFANTEITGGFWKKKQEMIRERTVYAVYDRFCETGRFEAFRCDWKDGMPNMPHFFWDSDVAKWIEGVAYLVQKKREPRLEAIADCVIDLIEKNQGDDGYFNIYYTVIEPEGRFRVRDRHELYCAGHLMEAAVAYYEATGKRKFLDAMCRYANYIEKRFKIDKDTGFTTPGHEEIEIALIKMYKCTGDVRYLELSKFFIDQRGVAKERFKAATDKNHDKYNPMYCQAHLPVREQRTAEGHSVRATYLYTAMADLANEIGDSELLSACKSIFDDIIKRKMYISGGIGSTSNGEAFTYEYDLPNLFAYTESCAAIGLALFANSMLKLEADSKYSDTVERVIYNGFMSSVSLSGDMFFYENPLEVMPALETRDRSNSGRSIATPPSTRSKIFSTSCCPPNIVRFIPSIANMLYTDDGETLYVHQYMQSKTEIERNGKTLKIEQMTKFPENGKIKIKISGADTRIAVRIPWWCDSYKGETNKGYAYFDVKDGDVLSFDFGMKVRYIEANPNVAFDCGKCAVMRGPVLYCTESLDNGENLRDLRLDSRASFKYGKNEELGVPQLTVRAWRKKQNENTPLYSVRNNDFDMAEARLIPYYAFANREKCEMQVWHLIR